MDDQGWNDIGYSFLIGGDGLMYEGRGWNIQGAHTLNYNTVGYGKPRNEIMKLIDYLIVDAN